MLALDQKPLRVDGTLQVWELIVPDLEACARGCSAHSYCVAFTHDVVTNSCVISLREFENNSIFGSHDRVIALVSEISVEITREITFIYCSVEESDASDGLASVVLYSKEAELVSSTTRLHYVKVPFAEGPLLNQNSLAKLLSLNHVLSR